jgi:hypothetical protein
MRIAASIVGVWLVVGCGPDSGGSATDPGTSSGDTAPLTDGSTGVCVDELRDYDDDGVGNACEDCPVSPGKFSGHCCDPRFGVCVHPDLTLLHYLCEPRETGIEFECKIDLCMLSVPMYGKYATACLEGPQAPPGALARVYPPPEDPNTLDQGDCDVLGCKSQWCTIGDDAPCGSTNVCVPWHKPGEAPAGSETLGACARIDSGPCVGKVGRECLQW